MRRPEPESEPAPPPDQLDHRLAQRLESARHQRGLTLDELAARSGVSRATISRIERAETSPTAHVLGRLCPVFGLTISQLLLDTEADAPSLIAASQAPVWADPETGFRRTSLSPPAPGYAVEIVRGELPAGATIAYPHPPIAGLEHHALVLAGTLELAIESATHLLHPHLLHAGDCLRYRLTGASRFHNPGAKPATYLIVIRRQA